MRNAPFGNCAIALDTALFFNYDVYHRMGHGVLCACRTDKEGRGLAMPSYNVDISQSCQDLDHWLHIIGGHDVVVTDRAHVLIAAAMLDKQVFYLEGSYHKVSGLAQFTFKGWPRVQRVDSLAELVAAGVLPAFSANDVAS